MLNVRRLTYALVGLMLLATAACTTSEPPARPGPSPGTRPTVITITPAPTGLTHLTDQANCPDDFPFGLAVRPDSASEVPYLTLIDACTDVLHTRTWLSNRSDIVWRVYVDGPTAVSMTVHDDDADQPALAVFGLTMARSEVVHNTLAPMVSVEVPAAPDQISWFADTAATGVFAQITEAEQTVIDKAIDHSPEVFAEGTRQRAMATCASAGYAAAKTVSDTDAQSAAEEIESVWGAGSGAAECLSEMRAADEEQISKNELRDGEGVLPALEAESEVQASRIAPKISLAEEVIEHIRLLHV